MTARKGEVFVSVALCASGAESVSIDNLSFSSEEGLGAKPRFLINFAGPGPESWGAGRTTRLTPNFEEPTSAKGEVPPCAQASAPEVAVILPGDLPSGSYMGGFDLAYRANGVHYFAHSVQTFGVCAVAGKHPKPLEETCLTMK